MNAVVNAIWGANNLVVRPNVGLGIDFGIVDDWRDLGRVFMRWSRGSLWLNNYFRHSIQDLVVGTSDEVAKSTRRRKILEGVVELCLTVVFGELGFLICIGQMWNSTQTS